MTMRRSPATDLAAVIAAEWRFVRRSLFSGRLLAFAFAAALYAFVLYAWFSFYHYQFTSYSPSSDVLLSTLGGGPSSDASRIGEVVLWLLVASVVVFGFDVRARDELARIDGPLDARPTSNLALVFGRLAAAVLAHWLLLAGALLLCHLIGFHPWRDAVQGFQQALAVLEPLSGRSLALFLFVDALPALVFWGALVFLLVSLLQRRAVVLVVGLALVGAYGAALAYAPPSLLPLLGVPIAQAALQSDLAANTPSVVVGLQRVLMLALAGGCAVLAAAWHPRHDDGRTRRLAVGMSLAVGAAAGISGLAGWAVAVDASSRFEPASLAERNRLLPADALKELTASVQIDPGDALALDVEMQVAVPPGPEGETLALRLNPGLRVQALRIDGVSAPFENADGTLTFARPEPDAARIALSLTAAGRPSARIGAARRPAWRWHDAWSPLDGLGSEDAIFDSRYVALMPAARWLPTFGDGPSYFALDLAVEVPSGWLVAAPGRREEAHRPDGSVRFRFAPATPVAEVALFASRFESRRAQAGDVRLEALFSPKHQANFTLFGDVAGELADRASALFERLANLGLPYPYRTLTVVEVPRTLRVYGSGWRMDSVQALPGILLLREGGFPTARFEFALRWLGMRLGYDVSSGSRFSADDLPAAKLDLLEIYFGNDVTGGNPWQGLARQWFGMHATASGEAALALDFLTEALALRLLTDRAAYFSAYSLSNQGLLDVASDVLGDLLGDTEQSVSATVFALETGSPAVWERLLAKPLTELGRDDPHAVLRAHALKADAMARIVLEQFGRERVAGLLARLLERHRGSTFEAADFKVALADAGMAEATAMVDHYLHERALAGFQISPLETRRLLDDTLGRRRYQALVRVRNGEPVTGWLRLRYVLEGDEPYRVHFGELVALDGNSAKEIGLVTNLPLASATVEPFLALNRHPIPLAVPALAARAASDEEPSAGEREGLAPRMSGAYAGSRPIQWQPAPEAGIVVDDLDTGFSIEAAADGASWWESSRLWLAGLGPGRQELDQGVPRFNGGASPAGLWMRDELSTAHGQYRRTVVRAMPGRRGAAAVFETSLPAAGLWRLEYHVPAEVETGRRLLADGRSRFDGALHGQGRYQMRLQAGSKRRGIVFDAAAATPGWNRVGAWELSAGTVRLGVSAETDGAAVVADAIRWERERAQGPRRPPASDEREAA